MAGKANQFVSPDDRLLHLVTETSPSLFDDYDLTKANLCLLDWVSVAIAGSTEPCARILLDHALQEGGKAQAAFIGTDKRGTARQAAMFNGTAAHAHDFDDTYPAIPAHTTVPVASAVWAAAEREDRTGLEVITAVITGIEVVCRLGLALCPDHYTRGWHASATVGAIGASAACAKLHGLEGKPLLNALELAACRAAGTKAVFGSMAKPLQLGQAAALGLESADLAQRGFSSSERVLNGPDGFYALHSKSFNNADVAALGFLEDFQPEIDVHLLCLFDCNSSEPRAGQRLSQGSQNFIFVQFVVRWRQNLGHRCIQDSADCECLVGETMPVALLCA